MFKKLVFLIAFVAIFQDAKANSGLKDAFSFVNEGSLLTNLVDSNRAAYLRLINRFATNVQDFVNTTNYNLKKIEGDSFFHASNTSSQTDICSQNQNQKFNNILKTVLSSISSCYSDVFALANLVKEEAKKTVEKLNDIYRGVRSNFYHCLTSGSSVAHTASCIPKHAAGDQQLYAIIANDVSKTSTDAGAMGADVFSKNAVCQSTAVNKFIIDYHLILGDYLKCVG